MNEPVQRPPDRVWGRGFSYDCRIGFHEHERSMRQRIEVDLEVDTDWRAPARADDPRQIVDYYEMNRVLSELTQKKDWQLLEAMAEDLCRTLCARFAIRGVHVVVKKQPFDMPNVERVAVECWRTPADFAASST